MRREECAQEAERSGNGAEAEAGHTELKLNVTDSQLVLVEDASVWDTNAVILRVRVLPRCQKDFIYDQFSRNCYKLK
jgi:predicted DCC family thiol-disulfide oxidoreductase YuxK